MENAAEYGPALPPGMQDSSVQVVVKQETRIIGPSHPPGFFKQEHIESESSGNAAEETSAAVAAIGSEIRQQGSESLSSSTGVIGANYVAGAEGEGLGTIGPLVSEMSHGDEVVQAAEEFERRSRKMKDHLTIKAEAEPGPSKREEWMTELPPEMGKNFGLTARTFSKGTGSDSKDRSEWTDMPADKVKKERDGKSKKRKKEDTVDKNLSKRDAQLQQQVEEYNKKKRPESLVEMHQKHKKKKKTSTQNQTQTGTESTQPQPTVQHSTQVQTQTQTIQHLTPQQQQQLQQHVVAAGGDQMQFLQLPDEIRESLDLLSDQKTPEYYSGEFQQTEFNEAKPLADLLLNQSMVGYTQDGTVFSQGGAVFGTSQMIAQAYNQAQQLSTASLNQHPIFASSLAGQVGHNMGITIIPAPLQEGQTTLQDGQTAVGDDSQAAGGVQALSGTYTGTITSQPGSSSISAFPLGQNVIIASPSTQQGNFIFTSSGQPGTSIGQNIVIATPGQQGSYLVKQETQEELAQTLVLASQNPQQTLGPNVIMASSSTPQTATLSDGSSVVLAHPTPAATPTSEGQGVGKTVSISSKALHPAATSISAAGLQSHGGMQPVSLVLPPMNSIFPQLQNIQGHTTSPNFMHLSAKMDKMMALLQETVRSLADTNKRLERIESHLSMTPPASNKSKKSKTSSSSSSSSTTATAATSSSTSTTSSGPTPSKSELKAALADYLTITDFSNTDELRRNDSSSDLFIPVGTVSLPIQEPPSPSFSETGGETATSTVSELPDQNLLVLNDPNIVTTPELTAPDSQSGIAVTIYDSEGGTYELGPDSSKDNAVGRFTTVSQNPKTVIVDPKFWEMLVEDFQKNMTSKQIMSALANVRKPLVRNMGNNEISICSTVLKEAEEACQGRRERLAKELVFRIFTLGEVYDRNVSGVFYIKGKKMENKHKALDPAKMSAIRFLVMRYPPSVLDNPRLEKLVWKNCVDRINDALRRIYNWIHKLVDINSIVDKLPTDTILQSPV